MRWCIFYPWFSITSCPFVVGRCHNNSTTFACYPKDRFTIIKHNDYVLQNIENELFMFSFSADEWLKDNRVVHITPIQLHCVTKQLTLPDDEAGMFVFCCVFGAPFVYWCTCIQYVSNHSTLIGSVKYNLGHLYDFLYQVNRVKVHYFVIHCMYIDIHMLQLCSF